MRKSRGVNPFSFFALKMATSVPGKVMDGTASPHREPLPEACKPDEGIEFVRRAATERVRMSSLSQRSQGPHPYQLRPPFFPSLHRPHHAGERPLPRLQGGRDTSISRCKYQAEDKRPTSPVQPEVPRLPMGGRTCTT